MPCSKLGCWRAKVAREALIGYNIISWFKIVGRKTGPAASRPGLFACGCLGIYL